MRPALKYLQSQKGVALITALTLGLVGTLLVGASWFLLSRSSVMITNTNQYANELDTAKGVAEYVMATIKKSELTCNGSGGNTGLPCTSNCQDGNCQVDVSQNVCEALSKRWKNNVCQDLHITFNGSRETDEFCIVNGSQKTITTIVHSFTVDSQNPLTLSTNAPERAILDVVYKEYIDNCK